MEWLISGSGITWLFLQRELATPMHRKHRQRRGSHEDQTNTGKKTTKQSEGRSCSDRSHDTGVIIQARNLTTVQTILDIHSIYNHFLSFVILFLRLMYTHVSSVSRGNQLVFHN